MADPTPAEVRQYIADGLPCSHLVVEGDGQHFLPPSFRQNSTARAGLRVIQRVYQALGDRMRAPDSRFVDEDPDPGRMGHPVGRLNPACFIFLFGAMPPWRPRALCVFMDKLLIRGGRRLQGEVTISGAKNAALPDLCAALLSAEPVTLVNVPQLQDVSTTFKLLANMGVVSERHAADANAVTLDAGQVNNPEAPYELVRPCALPSWCWARCWRALVVPVCRCRAAVPLVHVRLISTSRGLQAMGPKSRSNTAISKPVRRWMPTVSRPS